MKQKIIEWMKDFVEKPNPKLGDWAPCPFARAARMSGQIEIVEGRNPLTDFESINLDSKEVWIFWYPVEAYTGEEFAEITKELNDTLMPRDIAWPGLAVSP